MPIELPLLACLQTSLIKKNTLFCAMQNKDEWKEEKQCNPTKSIIDVWSETIISIEFAYEVCLRLRFFRSLASIFKQINFFLARRLSRKEHGFDSCFGWSIKCRETIYWWKCKKTVPFSADKTFRRQLIFCAHLSDRIISRPFDITEAQQKKNDWEKSA